MLKTQIMIVEDEVVVSADIKAKLEKMGHCVPKIIRYGEKVLEAAIDIKPDLILMDIKLKGDVDGIEAASSVKEQLDIPIVFLTSFTDRKTLHEAKQTSPYGYLVKPVRPEELECSIDITLYKAILEKRLKESELRFRTVADFTYDWEVWINPDNRYLYVSPSCERVSGYTPAEFTDSPELMIEIIDQDDRQVVQEHLRTCHRQNSQDGKMEFRIVRKDGEIRWIEHLCQPVFTGNGNYLGRRASNRDVTERKTIELEKTQLVDKLNDALAQVKRLSGLLPICSFCKRIRDDQGYWNMMERYISEHSEAKFSHGVCEECLKEQYPEFVDKNNSR